MDNEKSAESVNTVRVRPAKAAGRIRAELEQRLQGRLDARFETQGDRVLVISKVESEAAATDATEIVKDVVQGVRQTLGQDALDQGEDRISLRVE